MNAPAAAWLGLTVLALCVLVELAYFGDFRSGVPGASLGLRSRNETSDRDDEDDDGGVRDMGIRAADGTFPGTPDWDDHWGHFAARKVCERPGDDGRARARSDERVASAAASASGATLRHLEDMRRRYEGVGALADFYARGLGWIHDRLGMALTVVVAGDFADGSTDANVTLNAGTASVFVVDAAGQAHCGGGSHPPLTMWARANGPEVFAGTLMPHATKGGRGCAWRYDFEPTRAGVYSIHVKVLTFNGFADTLYGDCEVERIPLRHDAFDGQNVEGGLAELEAINAEVVEELAERGNYTHHRGLSGFKMYDALDACCEACTRARNCRRWSVPGAGHYDDCELYFDRVEDDVDFLDRRDSRYLGRERNYSFVEQDPDDFPNVRRRLSSGDVRDAARRRLAVSAGEIKKPWPVQDVPSTGRPRGAEATPYFLGCGWSSLLSFESPCHYPSDDLVFGSGRKVTIVASENPPVEDPRLRGCTLDDERLDVANGRWVRRPYPVDSVCGTMEKDDSAASFRDFRPVYHGERPPECWHRENLTRIATGCAEPGCKWVISHRWMTDLKREGKWYGAWEPHDCSYRVMGDAEIQQCVDRKKISRIMVKGKSIKNLLDGYLNQKLRRIKMTASNAENGTRSVFLDTLEMPHLLWHKSAKKHRADLEELPAFPDVTGGGDEHYWITGFYYTSEREPHVVVDRSLQFSRLAWDVLTSKGYRMINALDVTAAFAFDTDGQADGLHIGGPPAKAIVTKFLHHLCRDVSPAEERRQLPYQLDVG